MLGRDLLSGETVTYEGRHLRVEDGRVIFPPVQRPYPPLYFGAAASFSATRAGGSPQVR
jgi:alkanesulfonate monooxygenase